MKILLLTQEPPLDEEHVASGNAIRTRQLHNALTSRGLSIVQAWLSRESGVTGRSRPATSFRNQDELRGIVLRNRPDVIIAGYWELISLLPHDGLPPVVLDFVAPRPLEELFEVPERVQQSLRRLRSNLARCDLVMVGNDAQATLLTYPLLEAGFDVRDRLPVITVPLGAEAVGPGDREAPQSTWTLVSGGVDWPWRGGGPFASTLQELAADRSLPIEVVHLGSSGNGSSAGDGIRHLDLMPYKAFCQFLLSTCHIGLELSQWNIERSYSQSFRSMEFLRHGLPVICNDYLPIAGKIKDFDAGWVVSEPEALKPLLIRITEAPENWLRKSENARTLVAAEFQADASTAPLLDWLEQPAPALRLEGNGSERRSDPVLGVPPIRTRLGNQAALVKRVMLGKLIGRPRENGVIMVTRGDLFPTDHGAAVRTVATARALARTGTPVAIVTDDRRHWYEAVGDSFSSRPYPPWTRLLAKPAWLTKLLHYSKDIPIDNGFLYLPLTDSSFYWRILAVLRTMPCRILQAEFPAYAAPCLKVRRSMDVKVVLVEHNVEYLRLKDQVSNLSRDQFNALKAIETRLCQDADAVVCVSDNDRQELHDAGVRAEQLHTIAHGVDLESFSKARPEDIRSGRDIPASSPLLAYHGTFSYAPNLDALKILADRILPDLERKGIEAHVIAVGKNPPVASPHRRIHLIGSVPDLAPWLKGCDIAVVPLTDGGGTRMKIIDCFAAELPVVTTSKGIEGIPAVAGKHAEFVDDWDGFAQTVADLLEDPQRRALLVRNARALAETMSWTSVAEHYQRLYGALH